MLTCLLLVASAALCPQWEATASSQDPRYGWVAFSRDSTSRVFHSIKIFVSLDEKNRLRYIDDIGTGSSRTLTVKAPVGKSDFVVVVQPIGDRTSIGAPSDPVRRHRSNVTVDVLADLTTPVKIGGFTDFLRPGQGNAFGTTFVRPSNDPEASQFRTQIFVGKPVKVEREELQ